jgi:hypothetical protein
VTAWEMVAALTLRCRTDAPEDPPGCPDGRTARLRLSQRRTPKLPEGQHRSAFTEFDHLLQHALTASRPDTAPITTMSSLLDRMRHLPDVPA